MSLNFDFTDTSDTGFTQVPPGSYSVKTTSWQMKETSNGNPQLWIDLEVLDGEYEGNSIRNFQTITPKSKGFLLQMLRALGIVSDEDRGPEGELQFQLHADPNDESVLIGATVNGEKRKIIGCKGIAIVVPPDKSKGQDRPSVKRIEAYAGSNAGDLSGLAAAASDPDEAEVPTPPKAGISKKKTAAAPAPSTGKKAMPW